MNETPRDLSGFKVSPNPEVRDLEDVLGIKFQAPPARIELTFGNRLTCLRRERILRPISRDADGVYRNEYNAFFVRSGHNDRITAWHENMHGYVNSLNPTESFALADLRRMLLSTMDGVKVERQEIERVASVTALDEGIAEWASVQTALAIGTEEEKEQALDLQNQYVSKDRVVNGKTAAQVSLTVAERSITTLAELFSSEKGFFRTPLVFNKTVDMLHYVIYSVGYNFVNQAIKSIMSRGKSLATAIDFLIKNPPHNISDLRNPRRFVFEKLGK